MDRLREESRKLEQAQREVGAQLRAELKAKKARKKAEEASKEAEAIKKAAKEKANEQKKELRRQAELELRKEDEARVAELQKGQAGGSAEIYPADRAERKKFIKEWNQKVAEYQAAEKAGQRRKGPRKSQRRQASRGGSNPEGVRGLWESSRDQSPT